MTMRVEWLRGCATALVTPFTKGGAVVIRWSEPAVLLTTSGTRCSATWSRAASPGRYIP